MWMYHVLFVVDIVCILSGNRMLKLQLVSCNTHVVKIDNLVRFGNL